MRVALLLGGASAERDVSIASAAQVIPALRGRGHRVDVFDTVKGRLDRAEEERVLKAKVGYAPPDLAQQPVVGMATRLVEELLGADVVFLALHGGAGENGVIQAILDSAGLRYTGSGHLASAIAMDKDLSKRLFRAAGVPTPDWLLLGSGGDPDNIPFEITASDPLIVKPNAQGSTIGLTLVKKPQDLHDAVRAARVHDADVLIERFVPGREFVIGVLDGKPLAVGEIKLRDKEIFDYEAKYQVGGALEIFPADISRELTAELQELAVRAHESLKLDSYSRVDFRQDEEGRLWCLEVNTLPGLTATSLFPQSAQASGIAFPELCERICRSAMRG
ncbi:D-alanine--D-alanine ligase family protein [Nonomuraea africana]|uniref:D-alanine--D-alanine ligase family protein n=1 Tax=Nonomuraea africana TaxID=46171 RepID=UPI0017895995|nr:D-alanine--D-alanine ligase [Nonomuraea africana]